MNNRGFSLLENLIAMSILAIVLLGFVSAMSTLAITEIKNRLRVDAAQAAREGIEIAYYLSLDDWDSFATLDGEFHPNRSGAFYQMSPDSEILPNESLQRVLKISPVYRNATGEIVDSGGTLDPDTMSVISRVWWGSEDYEIIEYPTYITNFGALEAL